MTRSLLIVAGLAVAALVASASARADGPILKVGVYSQNVSGNEATIGARIDRREDVPGSSASRPVARAPGRARRGAPAPPVYSLPSNSPLLRDAAPLGPGSFWYVDVSGNRCPYRPDAVAPCYSVVPPAAPSARPFPAIDPGAIASSIADRLPLLPGDVHASPGSRGLTGAASWFWLEPAPQEASVSVTLGGETVTVTARPSIEWRFGDGATVAGGAGVSYRPGPPPREAVTHVYATRCLSGDRGRNPHVLRTCGDRGYDVEAAVSWAVSYTATGPVAASGSLPTRTTDASAVYPVSEARAFLVGGASR